MSSGFNVHNASRPDKIITSIVKTLSLNTHTIGIPSINIIPLGSNNTLYTIGGVLYYKSSEGTITVLATN
jgi:hypothetical protein